MKRILAALLLASFGAYGATLTPISLLNPVGSTTGQVIASTGPSTAPAWTTVTLSGLPGTLAISSGGTGATSQPAALANLLGSSTVPIANGGTGAATQSAALANVLGASAIPISNGGTGATNQATALSNILSTSAVPIANGGTGSTTQSGAFTNVIGSSVVSVTNGGTGSNSATGARTNLGLGTAATQNTGTSGATIPVLNVANTWAAAQTFSVRPTFNGATPYDTANLTISNYAPLASPTFTGTVSTAAINASGLITPTSTIGIKATSTNDSAPAGSIGEFHCAQVSSNGTTPTGCDTNTATAVSLTTGTAANVTSLSLTAGNWIVSGSVGFLPAAGTTATYQAGWISMTSATFPTGGANMGSLSILAGMTSAAGNAGNLLPIGSRLLQLSATTSVYLSAYSNFSGSTQTAYGFLGAFRPR